MVENYFLTLINNSSTSSKELNMILTVLRYLTLISRDFYDLISSFST